MASLRKRKSKSFKSTQPSKKPKHESVDSFLDSSDDEPQNTDISDIINDVVEEEKDLEHNPFLEDSQDTQDTNSDDEDIDIEAEYNELNEFHNVNDMEFEADEFDELSIPKDTQSKIENDDFLELGSDNDSDNQIDDALQAMATIEDQKKQSIMEDVQADINEQMALNNAEQREESEFTFPSYKRLLKEKNEAPNLSELKDRIESVLEILSNFKVLRDDKHSRKEYVSLLSHSMSRYYGYNLDLMNMFLTLFHPNECLAFLEANEQSRPLTIRTNTLKCRRRDLAKLLIDRGVNLDPLAKWTKTGLKIMRDSGSSIPIGATPEYLSGFYMIQSAASLLPTLALDIKVCHCFT